MRKGFPATFFTLAIITLLIPGLIIPANIASAGGGLASTPWPMFRHDLQHTGQTTYEGPATPEFVWRHGTGDLVYSSPAIGEDGTLYFGSLDTYIYAVNPDGTRKWRYRTDGKIYSSPAIGSDGTIYIGSNDQFLYAMNPDGSRKWKFVTGGIIRSSPVIGSNGTIYVGSSDDILYAINQNGTLKWSSQTQGNLSSSPAIGPDGTIYIGCDSQFLYAYNPSGTLKWRHGTIYGLNSSPTVGPDGTIYIGTDYGDVQAINPNGTEKWKYQTDSSILSSPALAADGSVYIGSSDKKFYAFEPDGSLKWYYRTADKIQSSPAIGSDGTVYLGGLDDYLYAFDPDGDTPKWRYPANGAIYSSPVIGPNKMIYFGTTDNHLYAIGEGEELVPPNASFTISPEDIRVGTRLTLDASASSDPDGTIEDYEWDFGDGTTGLGRMVTHTYDAAEEYNVTLTVRDNSGSTASKTISVTVNSPQAPSASFDIVPEEPFIQEKVAFDASESSDNDGTIVNYEWRFGDGETAIGEVVTHTYENAGGYSITLTVTDNDGLSTSTTRGITIKATSSPVVSMEILTENPVLGEKVTFDAGDSVDPDGTIVKYEWDFGDGEKGAGTKVTHTYEDAAEYAVTLTLTDNDNNKQTKEFNIIIGVPSTEESSDGSGMPVWVWIVIAVVAIIAAGVIFLILKGKKPAINVNPE